MHEVWISAELEGDAAVADIVEIAAARRAPLLHVARARLEREARSEAPQGGLAHAAEIPEADLGELLAVGGSGARTPPFLLAVDGVTDPGNRASQRVLLKAGLEDRGWGRYYDCRLRLFAAENPHRAT